VWADDQVLHGHQGVVRFHRFFCQHIDGGTGERAGELARSLKKRAEWGIDIVGHLDPDPARVGSKINEALVLGTVENISECLKNNVVDEVIIAIPRSLLENADPIAQACEEEGIKLRFMADVFNVHAARVSLTQLGSTPLLTMEPVAQDEGKLFAKRLFDLVMTTIAMPVVLPVLAAVALAIRLDSPGPVLLSSSGWGYASISSPCSSSVPCIRMRKKN